MLNALRFTVKRLYEIILELTYYGQLPRQVDPGTLLLLGASVLRLCQVCAAAGAELPAQPLQNFTHLPQLWSWLDILLLNFWNFEKSSERGEDISC